MISNRKSVPGRQRRLFLRLLLLTGLMMAAMTPATAGLRLHAAQSLVQPPSSPAELLSVVQFDGPPPPRAPLLRPRRFLPPQLRGRPRPPRARSGTRAPERRAAPLPRHERPAIIQPSQALRLAQRRWPNSIGLSVRLLKSASPVYVVKLKAGNQVVQVHVSATTGMILQ